jgi:hypothetical protein
MLSQKHRDYKKKGGMVQTNIKPKKQGSTKEILDAWTTTLEVQSPVFRVQDPVATLVRRDSAHYWLGGLKPGSK